MTRVYRVESRRELDNRVDELVTRGYKVKSHGDRTAHLKKSDWGSAGTHLILALFTLWWTLGLANALYAIYRRATAEEVKLKLNPEAATYR